jgi:hypothetical protein
MKIKLMLATVAVVLVGLAGTVEAGPSNPYSCTPGAPCRTQADCGVNQFTGQYLGICGTGPRVCLCYA